MTLHRLLDSIKIKAYIKACHFHPWLAEKLYMEFLNGELNYPSEIRVKASISNFILHYVILELQRENFCENVTLPVLLSQCGISPKLCVDNHMCCPKHAIIQAVKDQMHHITSLYFCHEHQPELIDTSKWLTYF